MPNNQSSSLGYTASIENPGSTAVCLNTLAVDYTDLFLDSKVALDGRQTQPSAQAALSLKEAQSFFYVSVSALA